MTHGELIKRAARWLRAQNYTLVLEDVRINSVSEQPDVIGWKTWGASVVVECKASIADFRRDAEKPWRREPERGMGCFRYYAVPGEIVPAVASQLPARWGLLGIESRRVRLVRNAQAFVAWDWTKGATVETAVLVAATRRAIEGWGRSMFGAEAPASMPDGDPHPSTFRVLRDLRDENTRLRNALRAKNPKALHAIDMRSHATAGADSAGVIPDANGKPEDRR